MESGDSDPERRQTVRGRLGASRHGTRGDGGWGRQEDGGSGRAVSQESALLKEAKSGLTAEPDAFHLSVRARSPGRLLTVVCEGPRCSHIGGSACPQRRRASPLPSLWFLGGT